MWLVTRPLAKIATLIVLFSLSACQTSSPPDTTTAHGYLDVVLDTLRMRALRASVVDWDSLAAVSSAALPAGAEPAEAYPVIRHVLEALGDRHSSFLTPDEARQWRAVSGEGGGVVRLGPPLPQGRMIDTDIGYVSVPLFNSGAPAALQAIADTLQATVAAVDVTEPCGWVVDLRRDMGGNLWPMLAGVGPLLGEGDLGYFTARDGGRETWSFRDGSVFLDSVEKTRVSSPYRLRRVAPPVAVLQGPMTASSGEALLVAFLGRPDTRSFGLPTAGLSTKNSEVILSDSALIFLTTARYEDLGGTAYGSTIAPQERIEFDWEAELPPADDPVLDRAIAWLRAQPTCH
jgi:carboxyl-terminal processing protease